MCTKLDVEWSRLKQLGWKLQCCYMPSPTQPGLNDANFDSKQSPTDNSDPPDATTRPASDLMDSSMRSSDGKMDELAAN